MTILGIVALVAAIACLVVYALMTNGRASMRVYDWTNIVAAIPLATFALLTGAYPSALLTASYMVAAIVGLIRKRRLSRCS